MPALIGEKDAKVHSVAQLEFDDPDANDILFIGVWVTDNQTIGLGLSYEKNGDLDVFLKPADVDRVITALEQARSVLQGNARRAD